jgi:hypothetical protein
LQIWRGRRSKTKSFVNDGTEKLEWGCGMTGNFFFRGELWTHFLNKTSPSFGVREDIVKDEGEGRSGSIRRSVDEDVCIHKDIKERKLCACFWVACFQNISDNCSFGSRVVFNGIFNELLLAEVRGVVPLNISGGILARILVEGISKGIVLARERTWTNVSSEMEGWYNLDKFDIFLECLNIVVSSFLPIKGPKGLSKRDLTGDLRLSTKFEMGSHVERKTVEPIIHVDHAILLSNHFNCLQKPGTILFENRFEFIHGCTGERGPA